MTSTSDKKKIQYSRLLFWATVIALMIPNVALCFTEGLSVSASATNILLPLGIYVLLMSLTKNPGKMVWWLFILIFFAAFQMVLLYLFGRGVIAVDMFLNLVTTNPGEAMELLDNLVPAVVGVFVVYLPILCFGIVSIHQGWKLPDFSRVLYRKAAVIFVALGLVCMALASSTSSSDEADARYSISDDLYPANAFYNLGLAFVRNQQSNDYVEASATFRFHATSEHPKDSSEVYVLVIGETARAHNFSIYGYPRDTNPMLSVTPGIVAFDHVTTQSNTTHKSVPMLLSAAEADNFSRLYTEKGILAAFREAGFHTTFISNQLPNHSFIDFLGQQADECHFLKEEAKEKQSDSDEINIYDIDLIPKVSEIIGGHRHKKEFIVLHTYGSHFNYRERYPGAMSFFKPDTKAEAKPENRTDLTNAYDNTIRYTDFVLRSLIDLVGQCNATSAVLYTSDHGENIFDDDRNLFLHASPRASLYELEVPFIVWTSPSYAALYPSVVSTLKAQCHKQVQSSVSAFHTMLQIGGVKTSYRDDTKSVASPLFKETPRMYLTDHNEAVSISRILD